MKMSWKTYALLLLVFISSLLLALALPPAEIGRQLAAIPGGLSLIGALYQLVRDEAKHQQTMLLQKQKQEYDLAITSHMANVAFDKHVLFCEEYIAEMQEAMTTLTREAGSESILVHGNNLFQIQRRHAAWLTPEIEKGLEPFETALRKIGASAHFYNADPVKANESGSVKEANGLLLDILSFKREPGEVGNKEIAMTAVIGQIRKVLGIEELTYLRQKLLYATPREPNP